MNYKRLKKELEKYKRMYNVEKELVLFYKPLYEVTFREHHHQGMQKGALDDLIYNIHKLLDKKIKHSLISKYIENGRAKVCLNDSIHFDEILGVDKSSLNNNN